MVSDLHDIRKESEAHPDWVCEQGKVDRCKEVVSKLKSAVRVETLTPTGLGYKRTSVLHKIQCLMHQFFILVGSMFPVWMRHIVAHTTDYGGPEAKIQTMKKINLEVMYPAAVQPAFTEDGAPSLDQESGTWIDFSKILHVPGILHILHNICKDVCNQMLHFVDIKAHMKALAHALSNKHYREAIINACFSTGTAQYHAWRFRSFAASLIDWRWGNVTEFANEIEPHEGIAAALGHQHIQRTKPSSAFQ